MCNCNKNEYAPVPSKLQDIIRHTAQEWTFRFTYVGDVKPGQFFQISIPKVGECPISVSGIGPDYVDLTLRAVGKVTDYLFENYKAGDSLFLRGPYGNGFDVHEFEGGELIIVVGGTAVSPVRGVVQYLDRVTPMMIGTYTGGSVNLVAMSDAFGVSGELVSASIVADNLIMAFYFFVLVMIPTSDFLIRHFRHPLIDANEKTEKHETETTSYWGAKPVSLMDIAAACSGSLLIVALSNSIACYCSNVIPKTGFLMTLINGLLGSNYLIITTITVILATIFPARLGSIGGAQEIGTYLIHIFFAVIGVPASFHMIITKSPLLLLFCFIIVMINLLITLIFGKIFNFNIEEIIIASNANIGGPTTAAAMAIAKGWGPLIVPAILVGTLGYVLGNYYGVFVGTMLGLH